MKTKRLLSIACTTGFLLLFSTTGFAQNIQHFQLLRVVVDGVPTDYQRGLCGFEVAKGWGGDIPHNFCSPVVWGYSINTDSLGCDSIPEGQLDGKTAMLRRGMCEFGSKALNAEHGGASAVLIANGYAATHGDDCTVVIMASATSDPQVSIPAIFICRHIANQIDAALQAGKTVEICYFLRRMTEPYAGYHYATPVSQVAPLKNLGFRFLNSDTVPLHDLIARAFIREPGGNTTSLEYPVPPLAPGTDTLLLFEGYQPPALTGEFEVAFTTNKYFETRDTLRRKFVQTDYTYASDNLTFLLDGGPQTGIDIFDLRYQVGSLAVTGDKGGLAKYCSFGIVNVDTVYVPGNPIANSLTVYLYKADSDNNGLIDLVSDFHDMEIVGLGLYEMNGTETDDNLIDVKIFDINTNQFGVLLEPNTPYFISVAYDGLENGTGHLVAFSNSRYVAYRPIPNESGDLISVTPVKVGGVLSYWPDRTIICRLHLDHPEIPVAVSDTFRPFEVVVSPNPAGDVMLLALPNEYSGPADVSIIDPQGRRLFAHSWKQVQSDPIPLDVRNVPSGAYMLMVRTAQGTGVKKVLICH